MDSPVKGLRSRIITSNCSGTCRGLYLTRVLRDQFCHYDPHEQGLPICFDTWGTGSRKSQDLDLRTTSPIPLGIVCRLGCSTGGSNYYNLS